MTIGKVVGGAGILVASLIGVQQSGVVNLASGHCPSGWTSHSPADEHAVIYSCEQGDILVVLTPDKQFERGLVNGAWVTDPAKVPGWE